LLEWSNDERIRSIPCATTDWSGDAADHQPPAQPLGSGHAWPHPRAARRACPGGPPAGRPGVLGTVPGPLRPDHRAAVGPDRDLPADDVLEVPLPAGLPAAVLRGRRLDLLAAVLPHPLGGQVPHPTTLVKLGRRVGPATVAQLNQALLATATTHKVLRCHKVRADTTVVAAGVAYPTDSGLLARAVTTLARTIGRVQAAGGATHTTVRDRRRAHQLARSLRARTGAGQAAGRRADRRAGHPRRAGRRRRRPGGTQRPPAAGPRRQPGLRQAHQAGR
jgi:hypothetical protein